MPTKPRKTLETFANPAGRPGLHDRVHLPGVHLPVPEDRPARFRDDRHPLHSRPHLRRAEIAEALPLVVPATKGTSTRRSRTCILDDLVQALRPRFLEVVGDFFVRGGIHTVVTVTHEGKRKK